MLPLASSAMSFAVSSGIAKPSLCATWSKTVCICARSLTLAPVSPGDMPAGGAEAVREETGPRDLIDVHVQRGGCGHAPLLCQGPPRGGGDSVSGWGR